MSHTLTESSTFGATVTVPDDGDARTASSVNVAFQELANRTKFLRAALPDGHVSAPIKAYSAAGTSVNVDVIRGLVIGGVMYDGAALTTGTLAALTANQWYYVYAYVSSGALALEISADPPDASVTWRAPAGVADKTRRYVTCFRSKTTTTCLPFCSTGTRYQYRQSAGTASHYLALNTGNATSYTDVVLTSWLPPHARLANLYLAAGCSGGGPNTLDLRTNGDTSSVSEEYVLGNETARSYPQIEVDSGQIFEYKWTFTGAGSADVYVRGFQE